MAAPAALHRLHAALAQRPVVAIALTLALFALTGAVAARVQLDNDMAALLPGGPGSPREAAQLLSDFGALDTVLLELSLADDASTDALIDQGQKLKAQLMSSGTFKDIKGAPDTTELISLSKALVPRRLYLLQDPAQALAARLQPEALAQSLERLKEQLASPEAIGLKSQLLGDPLGLNGALLEGLAKTSGEFEIERGTLLSKDKRALLWVATPAKPALSIDDSEKVLSAIESARANLPAGARLRVAGGPRFVVESSRAVKDDMFFNIFSSAAVLGGLFWLRFRGWRLLVLATVPLALGLLAGVAGAAALQHGIHGLSLGFGAAMVGIADDYSLHVYNRAWAEEGPLPERLKRAVDHSWGSLWLALATTLACFGVVWSSDFPALRQLATFAGIGISVAFVTTLLLLPPLSSFLAPKKSQPLKHTPALVRGGLSPGLSLAITVVALCLFAFFSRGIRFDGELRNLDAQRPETMAEYTGVMGRFGMLDSNALVVSEGPDVQGALETSDAALAALEREGDVTSIRSIATVVPSVATQRARALALAQVDLEPLKAQLSAGAEAAGFSATAFDSFWSEVEAARRFEIAPLLPDMLAGTPLAPLIARSLRCEPGRCRAVIAFSRPAGGPELPLPARAQLIEASAMTAKTLAKIPRQLWLMSGVGLLLNWVLLMLAYRSWRMGLLACVPSVLGLLGAVAGFAVIGRPLDIVSASALVLVLGCSVDYGIFVMHGLIEKEHDGIEAVGVLLASFTTLAGFATMAFAAHPALKSLGLAISLGILVSAVAALTLVPGLYRLLFRERSEPKAA